MNTQQTSAPLGYTAEEIDDAAVWLARLRAPDRSANVERGFQRWLRERPSRAAAFETVSTAWELTGALQRRPFPKLTRWERAGFRAGFLRSTAAVAAVAAVITIGILLFLRFDGVTTQVGEQRTLVLEDGTRVSLNTASRIVVKYDSNERRVELKNGEALFEVAKSPHRPFIVMAAGQRIEALGTSFVVRDSPNRLSVVLMEGKVAISSSSPQPIALTAGERLIVEADRPPQIDRPSLEKITAWRRGQVELEDTALAQAADEMNRYSTLKLAIEQPQAAALRINGVFRAGDIAGFAAAVARSYGLAVVSREREIMLVGLPSEKALSESVQP